MIVRKLGIAFHCHHDTLYEYVHDYEERMKYIREYKPHEEQELRLKLFWLIPDELLPGRDSPEWKVYNEAWEAYYKAKKAWKETAEEAYDEAEEAARKAYNETWEAYNETVRAYDKAFNKEIRELHEKVCLNCPFDGTTIFTRKDEDGNWY